MTETSIPHTYDLIVFVILKISYLETLYKDEPSDVNPT